MIEWFFLLVYKALFERPGQITQGKPGQDASTEAAFWYGTSFEAEHHDRVYNRHMEESSSSQSDTEYDNINW